MEKLLGIGDVCVRYEVSKWTVYQWTARNLIPHLKIGGLVRFRLKDLENWEEQSIVGSIKVDLL